MPWISEALLVKAHMLGVALELLKGATYRAPWFPAICTALLRSIAGASAS
jgi:hypothetical protein